MTDIRSSLTKLVTSGIITNPLPPPVTGRDPTVPHAPALSLDLTDDEFKLAIKNGLRYFPSSVHRELAIEFGHELRTYGHIYMYRFRPIDVQLKAYPLDHYATKTKEGAAMIAMIMNNLDDRVAQYPQELGKI